MIVDTHKVTNPVYETVAKQALFTALYRSLRYALRPRSTQYTTVDFWRILLIFISPEKSFFSDYYCINERTEQLWFV